MLRERERKKKRLFGGRERKKKKVVLGGIVKQLSFTREVTHLTP